jgi:arsenical pump membrane protein
VRVYARLAGAFLIPLALVLDGSQARSALAQAWPPFVLVTGLLLVGLVAGRDGLFDAAAARIVRMPGPPMMLALACFALVAVVTALLNLDTAVVFLTPVLIAVARRRGVHARPFLYGSVFMANASSLLLPGSNLTNLLVLSGRGVSGASFFAHMLTMALAATLLTAAGLLLIHRRCLRVHGVPERELAAAPLRPSLGLWGTLLAAALIVLLSDTVLAALAVLSIGLALLGVRAVQGRLELRATISWLGLPVLVSLLGLSVALGTVARASAFPADAMHSASAPLTAAVAALASVLVNNLPAAVLLSSGSHTHLDALLLGLNIGPNLAVTGSLAVLLWWRAARASGITPSAISYSRQGLVLAPLALAGALAVGAG